MSSDKFQTYLQACHDGDLQLIKKLFRNLNKQEIENIKDEKSAK